MIKIWKVRKNLGNPTGRIGFYRGFESGSKVRKPPKNSAVLKCTQPAPSKKFAKKSYISSP